MDCEIYDIDLVEINIPLIISQIQTYEDQYNIRLPVAITPYYIENELLNIEIPKQQCIKKLKSKKVFKQYVHLALFCQMYGYHVELKTMLFQDMSGHIYAYYIPDFIISQDDYAYEHCRIGVISMKLYLTQSKYYSFLNKINRQSLTEKQSYSITTTGLLRLL